ncbi:flagellar biosynthetic protein FliP [bacterium]|nr:flagellar biosynthetic protein FliP [bacterium]
MNRIKTILPFLIVFLLIPVALFAQEPGFLNLNPLTSSENFSKSLNLLFFLSSIGFIPFFLLSATCFLRIVIVLSMVRQAIGTQQAPPNMVIVSLALFLTIFVMTPTIQEVNSTAIEPYNQGKLSQMQALDLATKPFKAFMLKHTRDKDLALFLEFSQTRHPENYDQIPVFVLIPAFIISELRTAFQIGFILFIPFVVIDLIISNILLSLGMFMLSPAMISLPFKILLFVLTDGWNLIIQGLLLSYR